MTPNSRRAAEAHPRNHGWVDSNVMTRTIGLSVACGLVLSLLACDSRSSFSSPTSPRVPVGPAQTYSLTGAVTETTPAGPKPVEGVRVLEANSQQTSVTDADGRYALSGLRATTAYLSVRKDGYVTNTRSVQVTGDTTFDIQVERIVPGRLSGVISEATPTGLMPIEGVEVGVWSCVSPDCREYLWLTTATDRNGFYSVSNLHAGPDNFIFLTAADFVIPWLPNCEGCYQQVLVKEDTKLDILLVRH